MKTRNIYGWIAVLCGALAGCQRAPQTAADLQRRLPRQYQGEIHLQGEQQSRKIVVEPHDFTVLDTHTLEFNRVRYQLSSGGEFGSAGDAEIRGTISAPGLAIHLEGVAGTADVEGGDAFKAGTFYGTVSSDLQRLDATWKTGFGQEVTLKVQAGP